MKCSCKKNVQRCIPCLKREAFRRQFDYRKYREEVTTEVANTTNNVWNPTELRILGTVSLGCAYRLSDLRAKALKARHRYEKAIEKERHEKQVKRLEEGDITLKFSRTVKIVPRI
jgi:hypothetical protein